MNILKEIAIKSPLTHKTIGNVPAMSQEAVDLVIKKAQKSFHEWKNTPLYERADHLYRVADLILSHADEMTQMLMMEVGKDKKGARSEVVRTADLIRFTADIAKSLHGESLRGDNFPGGSHKRIALVTREPVGVVLAISPFNYPVNLAASKIAPALVAGNTVVFKPATQGSIVGSYLASLFMEAGLPEGVLGLVTGKGSEIGDYVVTHPDIAFINFTGSTDVGQHIAELARMVPLMMELGGKDAAIVLEDADLNLAASHIISGAFSYSGQRCTAIKRVLVVDRVADQLAQKLTEQIASLRVGNPLNDGDALDVVPLINGHSADYVEGLYEEAKLKGATVLTGGHRIGNLILPTLLDHVTTRMRVAWEEPFGPVLPIIRVDSIEEAIQIANASEYGLQSSVFTTNIDHAFEIAKQLEVGTVQINHKTERGPDHLPFMGIKNSGIGVQGIAYSIEAMTRAKSTVINLQ